MKRKPKYLIDDLPPDILAGIGLIIAWWGYLQLQLGVIIREAAKLEVETGFALTIGPDVVDLCKMIQSLAGTDHWIKDPVLRADMEKLRKDVLNKSSHRNEYAHGTFGYSGEDPKRYVRHLFSTPAQRIQPGEEPMTPESLTLISDEARALWQRAQDITHRLKALPGKRGRP